MEILAQKIFQIKIIASFYFLSDYNAGLVAHYATISSSFSDLSLARLQSRLSKETQLT
jgi:hypothetical protein